MSPYGVNRIGEKRGRDPIKKGFNLWDPFFENFPTRSSPNKA
jgi:hypothetical protein